MKECMKKMKLDGKVKLAYSATEKVDYDTAKLECTNGYKKALFSAGGDVKKADRELKRGGAEAAIEAAKSCDATPKECRAARKAAFMDSSGEDDDAAEGEGTVRFNIDAIREAAVDYVDAKEEAAEAVGAGTPGGRRLQVLNRHLTETATKSEATTEGCTDGIVCGAVCIAKDPLDAIRKYTADDVGLDSAVFDANAPTLCDLIAFGDEEVDEVGEAATETTIHFEGFDSSKGDSDKVAMKDALIEHFGENPSRTVKVFESSKEFEGATTTKEVCFTVNVGGYVNADDAKEHARRTRKSKNEDTVSFAEDAVLDKVRATKAWQGRSRRRLTEEGLTVTGSTTGQKLKTVPETETDDTACPTGGGQIKCADGSCKVTAAECSCVDATPDKVKEATKGNADACADAKVGDFADSAAAQLCCKFRTGTPNTGASFCGDGTKFVDGKCKADYDTIMILCPAGGGSAGQGGEFQCGTVGEASCKATGTDTGTVGYKRPLQANGLVLATPHNCKQPAGYTHGICPQELPDLCANFDHTTCAPTDPCCCSLCDKPMTGGDKAAVEKAAADKAVVDKAAADAAAGSEAGVPICVDLSTFQSSANTDAVSCVNMCERNGYSNGRGSQIVTNVHWDPNARTCSCTLDHGHSVHRVVCKVPTTKPLG